MPTYTELAPVYGVDGEAAGQNSAPSQDHNYTKSFLIQDGAVSGNPKAQERYAWLTDGFRERFGSAPTLYARAPGGIN